jgi:hypothetical protein
MRTKLARFVLHVAFGVGLCAATATLAQAQDYHYVPQGPVYVKPSCPYPGVPAPAIPGTPSVPGTTAPGTTPPAAGTTTPGTTAPGTTTPSATTPQAPTTDMTANAPTADTGAGAEAGLGGAAGAGSSAMLGRGDANNRFNLFDNNSAYPLNRVWFDYQMMQRFNTGLALSGSNFATIRDVNLYRVGGELACGSFSISFQDQYIASEDTPDNANAWGNPEVMFKWAFVKDECRAVAATFGIQPQVSSSPFELHENDTRFVPGLLFYQGMDKLFVQGGMQFNLSSRDAQTTFDWALSAGYWVCKGEGHSWLSGLAPQIEVYGQHTLVGSQNVPFDLPSGFTEGTSSVHFQDPRNVIDITAGGRLLLMDKINLSAGVSFPITGADVRRTEFLTGINVVF